MITVMGATGHTGGAVARQLLAAGEEVRALGRSEERLVAIADAGADPLSGNAADVAFLTRAFSGADAVYTLLPFDLQAPDHLVAQQVLGEAIVQAVRDTGVRHVVALSSLGAEHPSGTGLIESLHGQEQRLRTLTETNVLILRAGLFFEGFADALPRIEDEGVYADSVAPDVPLPTIATSDIAGAAARALAARDWKGYVVRELLGPRDVTHAEAAAIIGERLGRPGLPYVWVPDADMVGALVDSGASEDVARRYVAMTRAFNDGTVSSLAGRSAATTTPTRLEDFVDDLVRVQQAA